MPTHSDSDFRGDFLRQLEAEERAAQNRERGRLIDRHIAGTITDAERRTLAAMNAAMDRYLERYSPRPTDVLDEIESRLSDRRAAN